MATSNANLSGVGLRRRPDLIIRRQPSSEQNAWVVKDPVSLRYFTFSGQEMAIFGWLDGSHRLDDLRRKFEATFPPLRITAQQLLGFLANLYENGLLVGEGPDHAELLLDRGSRHRRRERWQEWLNVLAIRFRGIDPDRFLSWIYPSLQWCFSPWFLAVCLLSVVGALSVAFTHAAELCRDLPEVHSLLQPGNLLWLMAAFAIVKILHELGHALTCKHFGGECHEMGIMLLLFAPTLYCNVTDSWILRSRWQRIAVSAAGVLVEIQLAALAVFCWWYSQPGVVHTIALNTIVVCSVGTVLFNGNPLLRYDGYFVLADLFGIPNLWQESRAALRDLRSRWFLTPESQIFQDFGNRRTLLIVYGMASVAYQLAMLLAILLFLHQALTPRRMGIVIPAIVASLVISVVVVRVVSLRRFWERPMAWRQFRLGRVAATAAIVALGVWAFFAIEWPCRISAPVLLQPVAAERVYVSTPGTLVNCVLPGEPVAAGQEIARLKDAELERDVERLRGEHRVARARVKHLEARLIAEPDVAAQLEVAQEMLVDVRHQLAQRKRDAEALVLTAPATGTVLEPPLVPVRPTSEQVLPAWIGTPMDPKNRNCYLERGSLVCLVGDPARLEAILFVDETDVEFIRLDQAVRMQFSVGPPAILTGRVVEISKRNIADVPRELAVDQEFANRPDASGLRRPLRTSYSIRVALDAHDAQLLSGARGNAKIEVEPQSLAERTLRALRRTLTVPM